MTSTKTQGIQHVKQYKLIYGFDFKYYGSPARHEKSYLLQFVQTNIL